MSIAYTIKRYTNVLFTVYFAGLKQHVRGRGIVSCDTTQVQATLSRVITVITESASIMKVDVMICTAAAAAAAAVTKPAYHAMPHH